GVSGAALAHAALRALPDARAVERLAGGEPRLPRAPALLRARARGARRLPARVREGAHREAGSPRAGLRGEVVSRPFVFLDRDGTLIEDRGYHFALSDYAPLPGAYEAVRTLRAAGFGTAIVTNQSGIGRGRFSEADFA